MVAVVWTVVAGGGAVVAGGGGSVVDNGAVVTGGVLVVGRVRVVGIVVDTGGYGVDVCVDAVEWSAVVAGVVELVPVSSRAPAVPAAAARTRAAIAITSRARARRRGGRGRMSVGALVDATLRAGSTSNSAASA